jgi:filamentous hemagglutinin family protein
MSLVKPPVVQRQTGLRSLIAAALSMPLLPVLAGPPEANQLPVGGQVVAGSASISQSNASMTITQSSNRAAIDWQSFNLGSQAQVTFAQPSSSSVTLNRVLDNNPSQIFGRINANGQVFLSNPNGVYFAPGASVDVGGLVATTHSISNSDFMAGRDNFSRNGAKGSIVNEGELKSGLAGYIALLAPSVRNQGVVIARQGTVALAAGESYELQFVRGSSLANILVKPATIAALVENGQAVQAPGGLIILSAQAADRLQGGVVRNSGRLEATGLVSDGGTIRLVASDRIEQSGSIAANAVSDSTGKGGTITVIADLANPNSQTEISGSLSARGGELGGDGGYVDTSGSDIRIADGTRIDTSAPRGNTGNWLIDPSDFIISAVNSGTISSGSPSGDISGATLTAALASSNVSILSSAGSTTSGSGNIYVNDTVSWSANTLTMTAAKDIVVNAVMTASGTSVLALNPGTANGADAAVTYGTLKMGLGSSGFLGRIDFGTRSGTGMLSIGGTSYTVLNSLGSAGSTTGTDLQGMQGTPSGSYALGANITATDTSTWNMTNGVAAGFTPVGDATTAFTGNFDGLGHTITNLTINSSSDYVGLFGSASLATIRNVGLVGGSVTGSNSLHVAPLAGKVWTNAARRSSELTISNTYASGVTVSGSGTGLLTTGGLIGQSNANIFNSWATGSVTNTETAVGSMGTAGGLVGQLQYATVSNSWASGTVTGPKDVGGLAGDNYGVISNSYATGAVVGTGTWDGDASTQPNKAGGLVGYNGIVNAGTSIGVITNSYATGTVSASDTTNSYRGGLVGQMVSGAATGNFYSSTNNPTLASGYGYVRTADVTDYQGTALSNANLATKANFTSATAANGNVNPSWTFSNTAWRFDSSGSTNSGYPYLGDAVSAITISLADTSRYYGNSNPTLPTPSTSGTWGTGDSLASIAWGSTATTTLAAGTYSYSTSNLLAPSVTIASGNSLTDYVFSYSSNGLTVNPRPISLSGSRTYDASTSFAAAAFGTSGTLTTGVGTETLVLTGTGSVPSSHVAAGSQTVTVGTLALSSGTGTASNYTLTGGTHSGTITTKALSLSGSRAYDGSTAFAAAAFGTSGTVSTGIGTETVVLSGSGSVPDANVASGSQTVTVGTLALGNGTGTASDYTLTGGVHSGTVTAKAISLSGSRAYDASTDFAAAAFGTNGTLSTGIGTETLLLTGTGSVPSSHVAAGSQTVTVGTLALGSDTGSVSNYTLTGGTHSGTVTAKAISLSGSRAYDGTTDFAAAAFGTSGTLTTGIGTETVVLSGTGSVTSANVAAGSQTVIAGTLALANGTGTASDYTLTGGVHSGTVTTKAISLSGSRSYDGSTAFAASAFGNSGTLSTGIGTETLILSGTGSVPDANVAAGSQTVIAGTLAIASGTGTASNYTLTGGVHSGTITTATLSVSADNQSRAYGTANPSFTWTITGYVNGETYATAGVTGSASASTTATSSSAAGSYPITTSTGTLAASNYSFSAANGVLTVTGASVADSALPRLSINEATPLADLCITPVKRIEANPPSAAGQGFMLRTGSDGGNPEPNNAASDLPQGRMFFSRKPATCVAPKLQVEPEQPSEG